MHRLKGRFLYRVLPHLVDFLTNIAVYKSAKNLKNKNVVLLIDNTVIAHSITHETAWINTGTARWGNSEVDTGCTARIPVHAYDDNSREARSVKYLPGIAHLAKRSIIKLVTSPELKDEQWTQPNGRYRGYGIFDYSLFKKSKVEILKDPEYSMVIAPSYFGVPSMKDQRKKRMEDKNDPLYKSLVAVLGHKNSQDAWHITTAERNGCYCFLTMDFKLIKNVNAQANNPSIKSLKTKIMSPEDFGMVFGIPPISPRLYSYHDADCLVRHDLNWPDSKRKKPSKK
jgi:hypothetical protein